MGAEQSRAEELRRQRANQRPGVSVDEVSRLLEQQKREYERKLRELQLTATNNSNGNSSTPEAREAKEKAVAHLMAQQIKEFTTNSNSNQTMPSTSHKGNAQRDQLSSQTPTTSTHSETVAQHSRNAGIYPKLAVANNQLNSPTTSTPAVAVAPHSRNARVYPNVNAANPKMNWRNVPSDFVFVDMNRSSPRASPSAPSLSPTNQNVTQKTPTSKPVRNRSNRDEDDGSKCITCSNKYGLIIFQCPNGHSSCRDCKLTSKSCGLCGARITDKRNITLEAYIAERKVACPNAADGCLLIIKTSDVENHMKECPFKNIPCPVNNISVRCSWQGKISQLVSHFDDIHPDHRQGNVDTELYLTNIIDNYQTIHLVHLTPFTFLVHLKVDEKERKIFVTVQMFGTKVSAFKWNYEVHIYNKREPRRKFQFTDACHSSSMAVEEIFKEANCVAIPQSYAMTFVNEGCLNYKFFIKKAGDSYTESPSTSRGCGRPRGQGRGRGRGRGRGAKVN